MLDTTYEPIVEFKPRSVRNEIARGEASRNRVMAAARQELVEQGWKNFSLEEVLLRCQATEQDIEQWWSTHCRVKRCPRDAMARAVQSWCASRMQCMAYTI